MARIDLERRAEIGREKRARTRAQLVDAGAMLMAERPVEAITIDAIVAAAGVAKGTFYYHFQSVEELAAAVGARLGETFDTVLSPARRHLPDPIARLSFGILQFTEKAVADPSWAKLVVRSAHGPAELVAGVRNHIKEDLAEALQQGRVLIKDVDLGADIVMGIWLQVVRGTLERRVVKDLAGSTLEAILRALGTTSSLKREPAIEIG